MGRGENFRRMPREEIPENHLGGPHTVPLTNPGKIPGSILVRFEMPFLATCETCGHFVPMGSRHNASKIATGRYFSTTIFTFHFTCPDCRSPISVRTDPKNGDFAVVSGLRRSAQESQTAARKVRDDRWDGGNEISVDEKGGNMTAARYKDARAARSADPMRMLEGSAIDAMRAREEDSMGGGGGSSMGQGTFFAPPTAVLAAEGNNDATETGAATFASMASSSAADADTVTEGPMPPRQQDVREAWRQRWQQQQLLQQQQANPGAAAGPIVYPAAATTTSNSSSSSSTSSAPRTFRIGGAGSGALSGRAAPAVPGQHGNRSSASAPAHVTSHVLSRGPSGPSRVTMLLEHNSAMAPSTVIDTHRALRAMHKDGVKRDLERKRAHEKACDNPAGAPLVGLGERGKRAVAELSRLRQSEAKRNEILARRAAITGSIFSKAPPKTASSSSRKARRTAEMIRERGFDALRPPGGGDGERQKSSSTSSKSTSTTRGLGVVAAEPVLPKRKKRRVGHGEGGPSST